MSEHTGNVSRSQRRSSGLMVRKVVCLAMLCAIAYVVMFLSKTIFAPIQVAGFLTFDLKDVIIAIGGFIYGPLASVIVSAVVSLIEMVSISDTGPIGLLMNVLSTIAFVCPAAFLYKRRHKLSGAIVGLIVGGIIMVIVMILWNYLVTPLYMKIPREVVAGMLIPTFLPFNVVKAIMNGALTVILYKPIVNSLRKARLVPELQNTSGTKHSSKASITIIAVIVLATAILLALVLAGKI